MTAQVKRLDAENLARILLGMMEHTMMRDIRLTGAEVEAVRERLRLTLAQWTRALDINRETYRKITLRPGAKQFREPSKAMCLAVKFIESEIATRGLEAVRADLLEEAARVEAEKSEERDRAEYARLRKKFEK